MNAHAGLAKLAADLGDQGRAEALKRKSAEVEKKRAAMREAMPEVAAWVDEIRAAFGEVRVLYAREDGREVGRDELR